MLPPNAEVIKSYTPAYTDPLSVILGDVLQPGKRDDEFPGWIWCTDKSGKSAWVPKTCLEFNEDGTACALYYYTSAEMDAAEGDTITILQEEAGWYWCVTDDKRSGWIPVSHVERF
jgi:hypothetical protein